MSEVIVNPNLESILESVKKLLGLPKINDSFDTDVIVHINTALSNLVQMGIGPKEGFVITGYNETWDQFITSSVSKTQQIRTLVYLKVKSIFDPSANGNITQALDKTISELEYRLYVEEDNATRDNTNITEGVSEDD